MSDRVYIKGEEIELPPNTVIALTFQACTFADLNKRQGDLSNTISAPYSQRNELIFENSRNMTSDTSIPYEKLPARIVREGTDVPGFENAYAILESTSDVYSLTLYGGNKDFFSRIEGKSLRELTALNSLDHIWNLANVIAANVNTDGYIYPIADFTSDDSAYSNSNRYVDVRKLFPCVFVHTILEAIVDSVGFTMSGNILSNTEYLNLLIDCVHKKAADTTRLKSRTSLPSDFSVAIAPPPTLYNYFSILPTTNIIYDPLDLINATGYYIIPADGNYSFQFAGQVYFSQGTFLGISIWDSVSGLAAGTTITVDPNEAQDFVVQLFNQSYSAGDTVWLTVGGTVSVTDGLAFNIIQNSIFQCLDADVDEVVYGDTFPIVPNLPDIKQTDFVLSIMKHFCLACDVNSADRTIRFVGFSEIVRNKHRAHDMSSVVDRKTIPVQEFRMNNYARNNWLRWLEDESVQKEYGDGVAVIADDVLEQDKTIVQMPFAASENWYRSKLVGEDVLIIERIDSSGKVQTQTKPRMFMLDRGIRFSAIDYTDDGGSTSTPETNDLPFVVFNSPDFDYNQSFNEIINRYYSDLFVSLNGLKIITDFFWLNSEHINTHKEDPFVPWLIQMIADNKTINGFFYVQIISDYVEDQPTKCTLMRI